MQQIWILEHWTTKYPTRLKCRHSTFSQQGESMLPQVLFRLLKSFPHFFQAISSQSPPADTQDADASTHFLPDPPAEASMQSTANAPVDPSPKQGLPPRNQRLPARYRDLLPEPPLPAVDPQPASSFSSIIPRVFLHVFNSFRTQFNKFGIARAY